jgi:fatty-acyl-CoA synthase
VPRWWLPDDVVFLATIPKTSVGKFSKKDLREQLAQSGAGRQEEAPR